MKDEELKLDEIESSKFKHTRLSWAGPDVNRMQKKVTTNYS
jgi:hypothetical protein